MLFSSVFYADSFVNDYIAVMAEAADLADVLTTGGKIAGKVLSTASMVWLISGVVMMEIDGYSNDSAYAWKFGTVMGAWSVPFMGSVHYTTDWKRLRTNMNLLDPRGYWDNKYADFTLGRSSLAMEVRNGLPRPIGPDYEPFMDQLLTVNRDVLVKMPLLQVGPVGIQTTLPYMDCKLEPLGYVTKSATWQRMKMALEMIRKLKA